MQPIRHTLAFLVLATVGGGLHAERVRVTADRVNLRAVAQSTAEVVAQVSAGDELSVLSSVDNAWLQVVPPASVDLWIFAELVQGDQVVVSKAQVRAGAGLNFNVVGTLRRGASVQERGRVGDWMKIAPPEGTSLWISREYVEPLAQSAEATVPPPPPPEPAATTIPAVQPIPPPPAPTTGASGTTVTPVEIPAPALGTTMPEPDPRYPILPPDGSEPLASEAMPVADAGARPSTSAPGEIPPVVAPEPEAVMAPVVPEIPPSALTPVPAPAPPAPPPVAPSTAGWERPAPSSAAAPQPVRPRVLFPQQDPAAEATVGPANIPVDRLSPRYAQGKPGRYEGQLAGAGAIFYTPGKHRLVTVNRAGRAETVCYVLGSERQLNALLGSRLVVEGPVYWFRSTQYPTILAEQIQRLP